MSKRDIECAILFADVAGSTSLYEKLGDERAQDAIARCLSSLSGVVSQYGGIVIKTIGDEIMCRFPTADSAVAAACEMHEVLDNEQTQPGPPLAIRVGLHMGPAILERGDVFGDAVNTSARVASIARARQIITTQQTVDRLGPELQARCRLYDRSNVRGKEEEVVICEVQWDLADDLTRMIGVESVPAAPVTAGVQLRYLDRQVSVTPQSAGLLLGRGPHCTLVVDSELASRDHARIGYSRGKFVLIDQSTNGTYVRGADERELFLRREEAPLLGRGVICLGRPCATEPLHLIYFEAE